MVEESSDEYEADGIDRRQDQADHDFEVWSGPGSVVPRHVCAGYAELIVVGLLDLIAADLGVSASAAGALVTANALGLAVGGPILTAVTIRLNRRAVLLGALVVFIALNVVMVLADDYGLFIVARVLVGVVQGVFIAAGFAAGISVVEPQRMGRAMSAVISGVAVSAEVSAGVSTGPSPDAARPASVLTPVVPCEPERRGRAAGRPVATLAQRLGGDRPPRARSASRSAPRPCTARP